MNVNDLFRKLSTYESRLARAKQIPVPSAENIADIEFYEREVDDMKAELAVMDLIYELDLNKEKPNVVRTDCGKTVTELCQFERVLSVDVVWSWRAFKFLFKVEFYYKKHF